MQVSQIMSHQVITLGPESGLEEAVRLMKEHDIRHLPVVEGDRLVGLVTERDVRSALFPALIEEIKIKDLMIAEPLTIGPEVLIEEAARIIYRHKIGCLPVVDKKRRLKGILTVADLLAALIELMGFLTSSSRLDVILPERDEALQEAVRIIVRHGGRIIGISQTDLKKGQPLHLFRLHKTDLTPIVRDLNQAGYRVVSSIN
ncbi:MAG: CBS domain-containing protein [Thermodesulfobacteriota bacterium]